MSYEAFHATLKTAWLARTSVIIYIPNTHTDLVTLAFHRATIYFEERVHRKYSVCTHWCVANVGIYIISKTFFRFYRIGWWRG